MEAVVQPPRAANEALWLLPEWSKSKEDAARARIAGIGSVLLHVLGVLALTLLPSGALPERQATQILAQLRDPAKLVAPPAELTQTEPNRGKPSEEVDLEGLLPRPPLQMPPSPPSTTRPAARLPSLPSPPVPEVAALPEPPKIDAPSGRIAAPPVEAFGTRPVAPPQIQTEEKPKLAFESLGSPRGAGSSRGQELAMLTPPSSSVTEVGRDLARGRIAGGLVVGDIGEGVGGLGEALNLPPSPGRAGSRLELLSDPMGVDFRPYLINILSAVRRNWYAVMPESAKLGRRGRVAIQFAIKRDGSVPKLVIAAPSGTDALDRAAVAGISASNPFPPLPAEFRGNDIRLQFVFLYNIRSR